MGQSADYALDYPIAISAGVCLSDCADLLQRHSDGNFRICNAVLHPKSSEILGLWDADSVPYRWCYVSPDVGDKEPVCLPLCILAAPLMRSWSETSV